MTSRLYQSVTAAKHVWCNNICLGHEVVWSHSLNCFVFCQRLPLVESNIELTIIRRRT